MAATIAIASSHAPPSSVSPIAIDPGINCGRTAPRHPRGRGGFGRRLVGLAAIDCQWSTVEFADQSVPTCVMKTRSRPRRRVASAPPRKPARPPRRRLTVARPAPARLNRLRWSVGLLGVLQVGLVLWSYQLNREAQALGQIFTCLERRLNYPGTYAGTRCLAPAAPLQTANDPPAP